ncbi:hypothetical protein BDN67DRAFT_973643 [Paxillus ammoniavirescens]|nr:hypothetical protein BDN67DRAFT_973643 [Paxillus ammoniavirescens]
MSCRAVQNALMKYAVALLLSPSETQTDVAVRAPTEGALPCAILILRNRLTHSLVPLSRRLHHAYVCASIPRPPNANHFAYPSCDAEYDDAPKKVRALCLVACTKCPDKLYGGQYLKVTQNP